MDRLILREDLTDAPPTVEGRTLTIRLCSYGRIYTIGRNGTKAIRERILPGAFKEPLARPRGALRFRHKGERPGEDDDLSNFYGALVGLREEGDSVIGDFEVFAGPSEDKLLRLVETGAITGASMSAVVAESRNSRDPAGPLTDIARIRHIDGASITPTPAYDDAGVVAIREQRQTSEERRAILRREREYWSTVKIAR